MLLRPQHLPLLLPQADAAALERVQAEAAVAAKHQQEVRGQPRGRVPPLEECG